MNHEPRVTIIDNDPLNVNNTANSVFDDSDDESEDEPVKTKAPPGPIKRFFIDNKAWIITIAVLLLTITALSLTVYFINVKCNNTIREERAKTNKMVSEMEEQSGDVRADRDKYCEEAQRLRSRLRELSEEYDRLKNTPPPSPPKAVNKLQQKRILQEYNEDNDEQPRPKKSKKVTFAQNDEAISVDLPKPSSGVRRSVEEAVMSNPVHEARDMDAVVTAPEEDFDEDIIEM